MKRVIVMLLPLFLSVVIFAQADLPSGTELLKNNYFDDGLNNWELYSLENSHAKYELDTNSIITGKNSVHVTVMKPFGGYPSGRIQLNQHNIPGGLIAGNTYYISFKLKSNKNIDQGFWTIYKEPNYKNFLTWDWIKATENEVTSFNYTFQAEETDENVYFAIDLASFKNNDVELWIDDIHFIALPDSFIEPALPHGGTELISNNYFNNSLNNWELSVNNSDDATYNLDSLYVLEGKYCGHVRVNNTFDSGSQKTQFYQKDLLYSAKAGSKYHLQFIAKANKDVSNLFCSINQQNKPQGTIYSKELTLPKDEIVVIMDTVITITKDELVSWSFDLGTLSVDSVDIWFDGVHLIELGEVAPTMFPPETTWEPIPPVALERPRYLQTVRDPKYGVDYTCIADPVTFGVASGSNALLHHYSKDQAWNANMTKIILGNTYLLNADDYTFDKVLKFSTVDSRWSNTNPKIRYFCKGNGFYNINIETGKILLLERFSGYNATIGPWEGNISANDKYVVITHESGGTAHKASLYDIEKDSVIADTSFIGDIDWVTISPSGKYIVANNRGARKIEVYDLHFKFLRTIGVGSEHADFGVDVNGDEVFVQVIPLSMSRLKDGKFTRLLAPNIGGHISGRGFDNPGWALVSPDINVGGITGYYYSTQLFEIKLDGTGTIRHFGYARTSCTLYKNFPLGSVSPDGKKIIFNSDWKFGTGSGNALAYISEYKVRTDVNDSEDGSNEMSFELSQNYPNPFNPTTMINYRLNKEGMTKLAIYNILGQEVKILINENMRAGSYSTPFNGSNLSSGVYFYKLQTKNQVQVKKMMLIK